jgi:small subunit ribosomal protein S5
MKGNLGRKRQISAFVVTGNKNGSAGIALGKAIESKAALRKARNRAGQKLLYIEIFNNHTGMLEYFYIHLCT